LQTFPEKYEFVVESDGLEITSRELATKVGNAVPPKLGEAIGKSIVKHLEANENGEESN